MKEICFFGSYDPTYPRNLLTKSALLSLGYGVIECNDRNSGLRHYLNLIKAYVSKGIKCEMLFIGVLGHYDVPLAWILTRFSNKEIIFDAFYSLYDTYINDRKESIHFSIKALRYWLYDFLSAKLTNKLIFDTKENGKYFIDNYKISKKKVFELPVTSDPDIFKTIPLKKHQIFTIGFYGSFLPLHGVDIIIDAFNILRKKKIKLMLMGHGPGLINTKKKVRDLNLKEKVIFLENIPYENLLFFYQKIDLFLAGPFGDSSKGKKVLTAKTVEALSVGIPTIIGSNKATKRLLKSYKGNYQFLDKNDPILLSKLIINFKNNRIQKHNNNFQKSPLGFESFKKKLGKIINEKI